MINMTKAIISQNALCFPVSFFPPRVLGPPPPLRLLVILVSKHYWTREETEPVYLAILQIVENQDQERYGMSSTFHSYTFQHRLDTLLPRPVLTLLTDRPIP